MSKKAIIIISIIIMLLSSCSKDYKSIALISPSNVEISIANGDVSLLLSVDSELLSKLCALSALDSKDAILELEPDVLLFEISNEEYEKREGYLALLLGEAGNENIAKVLSQNKKLLHKSRLIDRMDECTHGYDSALLELVDGVERSYQYELSSVLYNANDWSVAKSFYSEWKR